MGYGCDGQYIWEKEETLEWNNLIKELDNLLEQYIFHAQENILIWGEEPAKKIFSEESNNRFRILKREMLESFEKYNDNSKPKVPMKQWILLGAVTEIVLQIFLTVFYPDYLMEKWQQWDGFDAKYVHEHISDALKDMEEAEKITSKQRKSIIKAVDKKINEHSKVHEVSYIMIDELIYLFENIDILGDADYIKCLRIIQKNRNCIHAYSERIIDGWTDLYNAINLFGCIVSEMKYRILTLDDV